MSSIFRILLTVSAAKEMALVETNKGCNTFSSKMFDTDPWNKNNQTNTISQK